MNTKNLFRSLLLLFVTIVSTSCYFNIDGVVGKGPVVAEHITVAKFTAIENASSASMEIAKGDSLQVVLSDYENLIDHWDVKVVGSKLIVQAKPFSSMINSRAKVTIVMPNELYQVVVSGSGKIDLNSAFNTLEKATISGSGNINGNVNASFPKLNLTISGSGSIKFIGKVNDLKTLTSGSGKMYLSDLVAKSASCTITGSGNQFIYALDYLNVKIYGSGDIVYKGTPIMEVQSSGSGRIRHE